jgi:hypothetical protein
VRVCTLTASVVILAGACTRERPAVQSAQTATDTVHATDSTADERPDSIVSTPASARTAPLVLLPSPRGDALTDAAAAMAVRAVFVPRNERWFLARAINGAWHMDIGRLDGGLGTSTAAGADFQRMAAARSPITKGLTLVMHTDSGPVRAVVQQLSVQGRRITAVVDLPADTSSTSRPLVLEWRGPITATTLDSLRGARTRCAEPTAAVRATLTRLVTPRPPTADTSGRVPTAQGTATRTSGIAGCFGRWAGVVVTRPVVTGALDSPSETVRLIRADGTLATGRLRDLSYPHHDVLGTLDVDDDGTQELLVRSYRPAMDTYAVLRMSDSVSFTRLARGFTVERR